MPKLLSRLKHEEFESNSALQIRDQKERREENTRKLEHLRNWFLQHCAQLQHCSSYCPFLLFTLCPICICFWFFPILTLVIAFVLVFFITSLTLSTYISLSMYKLSINSLPFTSAIESGTFPAASILHFLSFLSPFSAAKHSSEDDNSEDGLLDFFLLEEEGCWLGFEVS